MCAAVCHEWYCANDVTWCSVAGCLYLFPVSWEPGFDEIQVFPMGPKFFLGGGVVASGDTPCLAACHLVMLGLLVISTTHIGSLGFIRGWKLSS